MRNILCLCSFILLLSQTAHAHAFGGGDKDSSRLKHVKPPVEMQSLRSFPDLDKYLQENAATLRSSDDFHHLTPS
jgi:hypothetical protein